MCATSAAPDPLTKYDSSAVVLNALSRPEATATRSGVTLISTVRRSAELRAGYRIHELWGRGYYMLETRSVSERALGTRYGYGRWEEE